jgi:hypothetical protein
MRYSFTPKQYYALGKVIKYRPGGRMQTSINYFQLNYNLKYNEDSSLGNDGHWGYVDGEEKDINWFLLQL